MVDASRSVLGVSDRSGGTMKTIALALLAAFVVACQPPPANVGSNKAGPGEQMDLFPLVMSLGAQTPITWSITPGGGSVSPAGVYTAPTCAVMLAALPPATDLRHAGQITGTDTVTATWPGGSLAVNVTVSESVLGVDVTPSSANVGPGGTVTFTAVVHYTCHDQTTAP